MSFCSDEDKQRTIALAQNNAYRIIFEATKILESRDLELELEGLQVQDSRTRCPLFEMRPPPPQNGKGNDLGESSVAQRGISLNLSPRKPTQQKLNVLENRTGKLIITKPEKENLAPNIAKSIITKEEKENIIVKAMVTKPEREKRTKNAAKPISTKPEKENQSGQGRMLVKPTPPELQKTKPRWL